MAFNLNAKPLQIKSNKAFDGAIRGISFPVGYPQEIPTGSALVWAKDAKVRVMVLVGYLTVIIYGKDMSLAEGEAWLAQIARGEIQF